MCSKRLMYGNLSCPSPVRLQHLIELVLTGKPVGASFPSNELRLSTGKYFRTWCDWKSAQDPDLSSVVSKFDGALFALGLKNYLLVLLSVDVTITSFLF